MDRQHGGGQKFFFDKNYGAHTLMNNGPSMKAKTGGEKNIYDLERDEVDAMDKEFSALPDLINKDDGQLKGHLQRRMEFEQEKEEIRRYKGMFFRLTFVEMRDKHMFVSKRAKVINNGWKSGILGIETPDDPGSQVFGELQQRLNYELDQKNRINDFRRRSKNSLTIELEKQMESSN